MSTKVIAAVASVALAAAVGIPAALAAVGGNGPAGNQTVDDGSQVLTFSIPYYVVKVPTDRSLYMCRALPTPMTSTARSSTPTPA